MAHVQGQGEEWAGRWESRRTRSARRGGRAAAPPPTQHCWMIARRDPLASALAGQQGRLRGEGGSGALR